MNYLLGITRGFKIRLETSNYAWVKHVGKTNNSIEINGKRYNALTGALMSADAVSTSIQPTITPVVTPSVRNDIMRKPAKHATAHTPTAAKTLMRSAVKKPAASTKRHIKAHGSIDGIAKKPLAKVVANKSVHRTDHARLQKASGIAQSQHVSKFAKHTPAYVAPAAAPVQIQQPAPQPKRARTTADLLEQALSAATSHEQPAPKPAHHSRFGLVLAGGLAVLAIAIIGSQSVPGMRLRLASAKVGFEVSDPSYKPAGYRLGQLNYSSGEVVSQFDSNSNQGTYSITQRETAWDSAGLRDNFVKPADTNFQTVTTGGKTIFVYGKHAATWIDGGVWFQIQSDGSLSDQQLVRIATGL